MKTITVTGNGHNIIINLEKVLFVDREKGKLTIYFSSTLNVSFELSE